MGPDELDELLASIRAEAKRESALALYEGVREEDIVDEEVDERIITLLGLDGVYDIDYGTYISLLKEKLVESRNFDKKISRDEDDLLVNEFKRVKGNVGRFKLRKKKITAENIGSTGPIQISKDKFFLASKAIVPVTSTTSEDSSEDIKDIEKALDDILKSLTLQNKEKKKKSEDERKKSEDSRRRKREGDLEKPLSQLKSLAKKIIAPAQGILDRIFRFIKFTLLGYAFNQLVKWFSDPKNADKIKVLGRFLKDWWPALLAAYALFATPFGKFIRVTLGMLRGMMPKLINLIKTNPLIAAGAITGFAAGAAEMWRQKEEKKQIEIEAQKRKVNPEVVRGEVKEAKSSPFAMFGEAMQNITPFGLSGGGFIPKTTKSFFGGGQVDNIVDAKDISFEGGGGIYDNSGIRVKGAGADTQLIAAAPGEIVMSKKAVDRYGANFFLGLNKRAGGTNIPKMSNNIQLAAGGGLIRRTIKSFQGGGMVGSRGFGNMTTPSINQFKFASGRNQPSMPQSRFSKFSIPFIRSSATKNNKPNSTSESKTSSTYKSSFISLNKPSSNVSVKSLNLPTNITESNQYIKNYISSNIKDSNKFSVSSNLYLSNPSPRSKSSPPGPPVIISRTTYTVLPPIKAPKKMPSIARGSTIPEFIISSNNDTRSKKALSLGIADLVGVS